MTDSTVQVGDVWEAVEERLTPSTPRRRLVVYRVCPGLCEWEKHRPLPQPSVELPHAHVVMTITKRRKCIALEAFEPGRERYRLVDREVTP